jgi:protein-tyrosine phosphatase
MRILFVCTGNICRSPLAEAIFAHYVREQGLEDRFHVDSAGLDGWHAGQSADPRTCRIGSKYGVSVPSIARQFDVRDFERFDLILAMDQGHFQVLRGRAPDKHRAKVHLMRDYDAPENHGRDVEDPYYGGAEGFEAMFQVLSVSCHNLLDSLKAAFTSPSSTA